MNTPLSPCSGLNEQLQRIYESTGCKTQVELAALLGIRQSSVSLVKKHGKIPATWLVALYRMSINPEWVLTGVEPVRLPPPQQLPENAPAAGISPDTLILHSILYCFPADALRNELQRRREPEGE